MKKRIVVIGGTGYLGAAIVDALDRRGHRVWGLSRHDVDIRRPKTLASAIEFADAVVHAAIDSGPNAAETDQRLVAWIARELAKTKASFVYTSGAWVLGDTGSVTVDEHEEPNPIPLVGWRPEVERLVTQANGWVIRPGIVYGGSGGITGMLFASAHETGAVRIVGEGTNRWPLVHRDDLGDLYAKVIERAPSARILHATDGSRFTLARIAEALSQAAGTAGRVVSTPLAEARASLGDFADALALDQQVSSELTRHAVDWTPRHESLIAESAELWRTWHTARDGSRGL